MRGKLRDRHAPEHIENMGHRRGAPVAARKQLDDRNVERVRDRFEDDHGRVALPALDLREVALGGAGILGKLATGHAALGAREPHQAADGGRRRRRHRAPCASPLLLDFTLLSDKAAVSALICIIIHAL